MKQPDVTQIQTNINQKHWDNPTSWWHVGYQRYWNIFLLKFIFLMSVILFTEVTIRDIVINPGYTALILLVVSTASLIVSVVVIAVVLLMVNIVFAIACVLSDLWLSVYKT